MPLIRKSRAIPKKVIRLPKSAGISRKRVMAIYRRHVSKLRATKAPIRITQRRQVIGTDNTWFNAQTIERNPAWIAVNNASYVWSSRDLTNQVSCHFHQIPDRERAHDPESEIVFIGR